VWIATSAWALDPIAVLSPSDVPAGWGNSFGSSVAICGNYLVIGAPRDPWYNGDAMGAVYVFRRQGPVWIEQAKLTAPDTGWEHQLGYSVAIDGDVVIAGAPRYFPTFPYSSGPGAAYVFRRNDHGTPDDPTDDTWTQEAKLTAPDPQQGQLFGISVAINGDVIVAGKPYNGNLGSAEVFRWTGSAWLYEASLVGLNAQGGDGFGSSLDIDGNRIVVGAYWNDLGIGSAYLFAQVGTKWVELDKLTASDRAPGDFFGSSVTVSGVYVVVGAPGDDGVGPASDSGSAYVFQASSSFEWTEQGKLTASDATRYDNLGSGVSTDGDIVVVGKYLFKRHDSQWNEVDKFFGIVAGGGVAVSGKYAVVGTSVYAVRERHSLQDFASFQRCFTGSMGASLSSICIPFDLNENGRVDLVDFEDFVGTFVGPQD